MKEERKLYTNKPTYCRPGRRCKQWRVCDACARIRQAQIADVAEAGAALVPRVTYAVVRTYDAATINRDRERFTARLAKISEGGIWTIEKGERSGGMHINIIAGTLDGITAAKLAACWPVGSSADFWAIDIPRSDVRHVAAYCSKRSAMPEPECYDGRLYGSWGTWKKPLAALVEDRVTTAPVVAGAALQTMLNAVTQTPTLEARAVSPEADKRLRTLFAAHAGEIALHGYCYIPGHGIATLAEARRLRVL